MPCARRRPNSSTESPLAAAHTRAALVAMSVWKLTIVSSAVSTSWHCMQRPLHADEGLVGEDRGALGDGVDVEGRRIACEVREELRVEEGAPSLPRSVARYARSSGVKRSEASQSMACASPHGDGVAPLKGFLRKWRWKTASRSVAPSSSTRRPW
jgi:hypothetical protein